MPEENKDTKIGVNDNIPAIYDKNGEILRNTKIYNENFFKFIYNFLSRYDKKNIEVVIFFITVISILSQVFVYSYEAGKLDYFAIDRSVIKNFSIIEIIYNSFAGVILFTLFILFMLFTFFLYRKDNNVSWKKYITMIIINHIWIVFFIIFKSEFKYGDFSYILYIFSYIVLSLVLYFYYIYDKEKLIAYIFSLGIFFSFVVVLLFFEDKITMLLMYRKMLTRLFTTESGIKFCIVVYVVVSILAIILYLYILFFKKSFTTNDKSNSTKKKSNFSNIILYVIELVLYMLVIIIVAILIYSNGFGYAKNREDFKVITYSENEDDIDRIIVYENSENYVICKYNIDENKKNLELENKKQKLIPKDNIEFEIKNFKDYNITLEERK
jgi:membrane protein